jgi:molecular chaperone DnaJ
VAGEGEAGIACGPPGDLYVVIRVAPHPLFVREGPDLVCEVPIPFVQAALGAEIEVPTLEGKVALRISEGTQSGKVLRLRGKGLPSVGSATRGDQLVRLFVEVPTQLTARQRELLEKFAAEGGTEVSPVTKSFLEKLRDLFD